MEFRRAKVMRGRPRTTHRTAPGPLRSAESLEARIVLCGSALDANLLSVASDVDGISACAILTGVGQASPIRVQGEIGRDDGTSVGPTDVDLIRFHADAGQTISFDLRSHVGIRPLDATLRLFRTTGEMLASNSDRPASIPSGRSEDPWLEHLFLHAGDYLLGISGEGNATYDPMSAADRVPGEMGRYELAITASVERGHPDVLNYHARANDQILPVAAVDRQGTTIVVWSQGTASGVAELMGQRFDIRGAAYGSRFVIARGSFGAWSVGANSAGDFAVAYLTRDAAAAPILQIQPYRVFGERVEQLASLQAGEPSVVTGHTAIAINATGTIAVAWTGLDQFVRLQTFQPHDSDAYDQHASFLIDSTGSPQQEIPSPHALAVGANNEFLVTWIAGDALRTRSFSELGAPIMASETLITVTDVSLVPPRLAGLPGDSLDFHRFSDIAISTDGQGGAVVVGRHVHRVERRSPASAMAPEVLESTEISSLFMRTYQPAGGWNTAIELLRTEWNERHDISGSAIHLGTSISHVSLAVDHPDSIGLTWVESIADGISPVTQTAAKVAWFDRDGVNTGTWSSRKQSNWSHSRLVSPAAQEFLLVGDVDSGMSFGYDIVGQRLSYQGRPHTKVEVVEYQIPVRNSQHAHPTWSVSEIVDQADASSENGVNRSGGLAIVGVDRAGGHFEYSDDSGVTWSSVGESSVTSALVLSREDRFRLRWIPSSDELATWGRALQFRLWNTIVGTAGSRADISADVWNAALSDTTVELRIVTAPSVEATLIVDSDYGPTELADLGTPTAAMWTANGSGEVTSLWKHDFGWQMQRWGDGGVAQGESIRIADASATRAMVVSSAFDTLLVIWQIDRPDGTTSLVARSWEWLGVGWQSGSLLEIENAEGTVSELSATIGDDGQAIIAWSTAVGKVCFRRLNPIGWLDFELGPMVELGSGDNRWRGLPSSQSTTWDTTTGFQLIWREGADLRWGQIANDGSSIADSEVVASDTDDIVAVPLPTGTITYSSEYQTLHSATLLLDADHRPQIVTHFKFERSLIRVGRSGANHEEAMVRSVIGLRQRNPAGTWTRVAQLLESTFESAVDTSENRRETGSQIESAAFTAGREGTIGVVWTEYIVQEPSNPQTFVQWWHQDRKLTERYSLNDASITAVEWIPSGNRRALIAGQRPTSEFASAEFVAHVLNGTPRVEPQQNRPIIWQPIEYATTRVGESFDIPLSIARESASTAPTVWTLGNEAPAEWYIIPSSDGESARLRGTANVSAGVVVVTVTASIGVDVTTKSQTTFLLHVEPSPATIIVQQPTIQTAIVGEEFRLSFDAVAEQPQRADLRFSLEQDPPTNATINSRTGMILWRPTSIDVGVRRIYVRVSDDRANHRPELASFLVRVLPINQAPSIRVDGEIRGTEDRPIPLFEPNPRVIVDDVDAAGGDATATIVAYDGRIALADSGNAELLLGNAVNASTTLLQLRGTVAEINTAISTLTFYPALNFHGTAHLRFDLDDGGNNGTHSPLQTQRDIPIYVSPVAEAPRYVGTDLTIQLPVLPRQEIATLQWDIGEANDPIVTRVLAGNEDGGLDVEPVTGRILVARPEVWIAGAEREVTLQAYYQHSPTRTLNLTVTIRVESEENSGPVAVDDYYVVQEDTPISGNVRLGDRQGGVADWDLEGDALYVSRAWDSHGRLIEMEQPFEFRSGARLTLNTLGDFSFDPTPSHTWDTQFESTSSERITYEVHDLYGNTDQGEILFEIQHSNDMHVASIEQWAVSPHTRAGEVIGRVRVKNIEPTEELRYSWISGQQSGIFRLNSDGTISLIAPERLVATSTYALQIAVRDQASRTVAAQITVRLRENQIPVNRDEAIWETGEDVPLSGSLLLANHRNATVYDPDPNETLQVISVDGSEANVGRMLKSTMGASVRIDSTGNFHYDPRPSALFSRMSAQNSYIDRIPYEAADPWGASINTELVVRIVGRNAWPQAIDNHYYVNHNRKINGNLIRDPHLSHVDSDPDADYLFVVRAGGINFGLLHRWTTSLGASMTLAKDGTFSYDATSIPGIDGLAVGTRLYDGFDYTVSDGSEIGVSSARAHFVVTVAPEHNSLRSTVTSVDLLHREPGVSVVPATSNPQLLVNIDTVLPAARAVIMQFNWDAFDSFSGDGENPVIQSQITIPLTGTGAVQRQIAPNDMSLLSTSVGRKVIAYRSIVQNSLSQAIEVSRWKYFEFELISFPASGDIRLVTFGLHRNDDPLPSDYSVPQVPDLQTTDPRIEGEVQGNFQNRSVWIELSYVRDGTTYLSEVPLPQPGIFVYDPRIIDPGLHTFSGTIVLQYRLFARGAGGGQIDELLVDDIFMFQLDPLPSVPGAIEFTESSQPNNLLLPNARRIEGTVSGAVHESGFVEFDVSRGTSGFDGLPDGETPVVADSTLQGRLRFMHETALWPGNPPTIRARFRVWSDQHGAYLYGQWSLPHMLATITPPAIDEAVWTEASARPGEYVTSRGQITGSLVGALPRDNDEDSSLQNPTNDLSRVAFVSLQFFHHGNTLQPSSIPNGIALTDGRGHFHYELQGLVPGVHTIQIRTVVSLSAGAGFQFGPTKSVIIPISGSTAPTVIPTSFALADLSEAHTEVISGGALLWHTPDATVTGFVSNWDDVAAHFPYALVEFAHDYLHVAGDENLVVDFAAPTSDGQFVYSPVSLANFPVRLRARAVAIRGSDGSSFTQPWIDLYLQQESHSEGQSSVEHLHVVHRLLTDPSGVEHTVIPAISGQIVGPAGTVGGQRVQLRDAASGTLLGVTRADEAGNFSHHFTQLPLGTHTIQTCVEVWDYALSGYDWKACHNTSGQLTFVLEQPPSPIITRWGLASDTGVSQTDGMTANGLLVGAAGYSSSQLDIQTMRFMIGIDVGSDGSIDHHLETDDGGHFSFELPTLDHTTYSFRASIATWDSATHAYRYSGGNTIAFTKVPAVGSAPEFANVQFVHPIENGNSRRDASLRGWIIHETDLSDIDVELDWNNDGVVDQITQTDRLGYFELHPHLLPPNDNLTLRLRARDDSPDRADTLTSQWLIMPPFDYRPKLFAEPTISHFALKSPTSTSATPIVSDDPTLQVELSADFADGEQTVEFSFTANGPVIGTVTIHTGESSVEWRPRTLMWGNTYEIWVRVRRSFDGTEVIRYSAPQQVIFTYQEAIPTGLHFATLNLLHDTHTLGGSTPDDGSTDDSRVTGSIAGIAPLSNIVVQIDWTGDSVGDGVATTDGTGRFVFSPNLTHPGYHVIRARALHPQTGLPGSWDDVGFVWDTNASSSRALGLVAALSTVNPNWQQTDATVDLQHLPALLDTLQMESERNAAADREWREYLDDQARSAANQAAAANQQGTKLSSENAYRAATEAAQQQFQTAIAGLPLAEQLLLPDLAIEWPDRPPGLGVIVPDDKDQPARPISTHQLGTTFNAERDLGFVRARSSAENRYQEAVQQLFAQLNEQREASDHTYETAVADALETYNTAIRELTDDHVALSSGTIHFNQDEFERLVMVAEQAWESYYADTSRLGADSYRDLQSLQEHQVAELRGLINDRQIELESAEDRAFDDDCEHPDEGVRLAYTEFVCSVDAEGVPQYGYTYERADGSHAFSRFFSPHEHNELNRLQNEIRKRYAPDFANVLNDYLHQQYDTLHNRHAAYAQLLSSTLGTIYGVQRDLAKLNRHYQHDLIVESIEREASYLGDWLAIRTEYDRRLATSVRQRGDREADIERQKSLGLADAQLERSRAVASARVGAFSAWAAVDNSPWAEQQVALARLEETYHRAIAEARATRDRALAEGKYQQQRIDVANTMQRTLAQSDAETARAIALREAIDADQIARDDVLVARDESLADAWFSRQIDIADADRERQISDSLAQANLLVQLGEANNALFTATDDHLCSCSYQSAFDGWAYDRLEQTWWGSDELLFDNRQVRDELIRTHRQDQADAHHTHRMGLADSDFNYEQLRLEAVLAYRQTADMQWYISTVDLAELNALYHEDVATIQNQFFREQVRAATRYTITDIRGDAMLSLATGLADVQFETDQRIVTQHHGVETIRSQGAFDVAASLQHRNQIQQWAGASPTPWQSLSIRLAEIELAHTASIAEQNNRVAADREEIGREVTLRNDAANRDYLIAVYGTRPEPALPEIGDPFDRDGALVRKSDRLADLELQLAEHDAIYHYVLDQATAARDRDLRVISQDQEFTEILTLADIERDRRVQSARHDLRYSTSAALHAYDKPSGITEGERNQLLGEATELYNKEVSRASRARTLVVAQARRDWTYDVSQSNVDYVDALVGYQLVRSQRDLQDLVVRGEAIATAESAFLITELESRQARDVIRITINRDEQIANAGVDHDLADANDQSNANFSLDRIVARGEYEVALHAERSLALQDAHRTNPTHFTQYQQTLAAAQYASATTIASLEVAHQLAVTSSNVAYQSESRQRELARRIADAESEFQMAEATLRATATGERLAAETSATLYAANQRGLAHYSLGSAEYSGDTDRTMARATRDRDRAFADAGVSWIEEVGAARYAFEESEITYEDFVAAFADAEQRRMRARDEAEQSWRVVQSEAYRQRISQMAVLRTEFITSKTMALSTYARDDATRNAEIQSIIAELHDSRRLLQVRDETIQSRDQGWADILHRRENMAREIILTQRQAESRVTFAAARAMAEANLNSAEAAATAATWRSIAGNASPVSGRGHQAALLEVRADWIAAMITPYVALQVAIETAESQQEVDNQIARLATEDQSSVSRFSWRQSTDAIERDYVGQLSAVRLQAQTLTLQSDTERLMATVDARNALYRERATIEQEYDASIQRIVDEHASEPDGDIANAKRREAAYNRDLARNDAELAYRAALARAEQVHGEEHAARDRWQSLQELSLETAKSRLRADVDLRHDQHAPYIDTERWAAETSAENQYRATSASAQAAWLTASFDNKVAAARQLQSAMLKPPTTIGQMSAGYRDGNLVFAVSQGNNGATERLVDVAGSYFVRHSAHGGATVTLPPHGALVVQHEVSGTAYLMHTQTAARDRFPGQQLLAGSTGNLLLVRFAANSWQFSTGQTWLPFQRHSSDTLLATVDLTHLAAWPLGGAYLWADYQVAIAEMEQDAWNVSHDDFLQWHTLVSEARSTFTSQRIAAYLVANKKINRFRHESAVAHGTIMQHNLSDAIEARYARASNIAVDLQQYRVALAELEHGIARDLAQARLNEDRTDEIENNAIRERERIQSDYQTQVSAQLASVDLRIGGIGLGMEYELARNNRDTANAIAAASQEFDSALLLAYFGSTAGEGLEPMLAELNYNYSLVESTHLVASSDRANSGNILPWMQLANAQIDAEHRLQVESLLASLRDERLHQASVRFEEEGQRRSLARSLSLSQATIDLQLQNVGAMANYFRLESDDRHLEELVVPDVISIPLLEIPGIDRPVTDYRVTQPGSISDEFYYSYNDGLWSDGAFYWTWLDGLHYYSRTWSQFDWGWAFSYGAGLIVESPTYSHAFWAYSAWSAGWNNWSSDYMSPPPRVRSDYPPISSTATVAYVSEISDALEPLRQAIEAIEQSANASPVLIEPLLGQIVLSEHQLRFSDTSGYTDTIDSLLSLTEQQASDFQSELRVDRPLSAGLPGAPDQATDSNIDGSTVDRMIYDSRLSERIQFQVVDRVVYFERTKKIPLNDDRGLFESDVIWHELAPVRIGIERNHGWVYFDESLGGGRATLSALQRAAEEWASGRVTEVLSELTESDPTIGDLSLQELVDAVRSPYAIEPGSASVGLFLGGTNMTMNGVGNVERLYNAYQGTKFYYGGIGNVVDSNYRSLTGGTGLTFELILMRGLSDIKRYVTPGMQVHIYGWSRGAAIAVELARRVGDELGIAVDFLGLFDPVYSVGLPGQSSLYVEFTREGKAGNYVTGLIPANVEAVTTIYAMNEIRSWFPATRWKAADERTRMFAIGSPGAHAEVGGHWLANANVQQLNYRTMIEYSHRHSSAQFVFQGLEIEIEKLIKSELTVYYAMDGVEGRIGDAASKWADEVFRNASWKGYEEMEYRTSAENRAETNWVPGSLGSQREILFDGNIAKPAFLFSGALLWESIRQPIPDHYPRRLSWVVIGLWDTFSGIDRSFFDSLYRRRLDPNGGWTS